MDHSIVFSRKTSRRKILRSKELRRSMALPESKLWGKLRAHRLCDLHFRRQVVIEPYIVDFYCSTAKLVIEFDGEVHSGQKGMDAERDRFLQSMGLNILRFSNKKVMDEIDATVGEIEIVCRKLIG
jgi:very-short-patch-repair endonuclease